MRKLVIFPLALLLLLTACSPAGTVQSQPPEQSPQQSQAPAASPSPTPDVTPTPSPAPTPEPDSSQPPEATPAPSQSPDVSPEPAPSAAPATTPEPAPTEPATYTPDENGMLYIDGWYIDAGKAVDEASVKGFAHKLKDLRESYFPDSPVYYATIPGKSYFVRTRTEHYLDHGRIANMLSGELAGWNRIDLAGLLTLDDYYNTDPHWRQERLLPIVKKLGQAMGFSVNTSAFTTRSQKGFVGTYNQKLSDLPSETVHWLTSPHTQAATVNSFGSSSFSGVYNTGKLGTESAYDLFLSGPIPLLEINTPNAAETRELVIFRDSYGSSLAPLLLEGYSKITLVDLRYMFSGLLPNYVSFAGADVLFLYSDAIVNNSQLLK